MRPYDCYDFVYRSRQCCGCRAARSSPLQSFQSLWHKIGSLQSFSVKCHRMCSL